MQLIDIYRSPVVCGVTSLGMDHTSVLGNTIEEIAWNKAGIFKVEDVIEILGSHEFLIP